MGKAGANRPGRWRPLCRDKEGRVRRGETHPAAVLTEDLVRLIRRLRAEGLTWSEIARRLGHKLGTVRNAGAGDNWKHVAP